MGVESDEGSCGGMAEEHDEGSCGGMAEEHDEASCGVVVEESDEASCGVVVGLNGACGEDDGGACACVLGMMVVENGAYDLEMVVVESGVCACAQETMVVVRGACACVLEMVVESGGSDGV
ncbi:hypothetical protein TanjilG_12196 [Lupinus angustifolius]|uniref:Uncharacterized protein n=1 Tax=Lupinus angustifolius TaxID=3871 RepID=A0A1J7GMH3_LUPAN|nr:hypothetical protein TanjilG_12196 [Lupinus angustifolius]